MKNTKIVDAFARQLNEKYYTRKECQYSNSVGLLLNPTEYNELIAYKENLVNISDLKVTKLPLLSFNFKYLYYAHAKELTGLINDYQLLGNNSDGLIDRFSSTFLESRIYSEIEGSLNVENVPATRRRLKELLEDNAPSKDPNDRIIKNMKVAIDYVNELPAFNKENLYHLYNLLSKKCLEKENQLKSGELYRYDSVEISRYYGCPADKIEESMNSLFTYVNNTLKSKNEIDILLLPHIAHYYILYIHPYFDLNGRTARMVSYWLYLLSDLEGFPPIISEAINLTKKKYYQAIELSRDDHNDLTYFLKYLLEISIDYMLAYQNLKHIEQLVKNKGQVLTETELNYIKKIMISYQGAFTYSDFLKMANVTISKQGALKILNKFVKMGILKEVKTISRFKLFALNKVNVLYALKNICGN